MLESGYSDVSGPAVPPLVLYQRPSVFFQLLSFEPTDL